MSTHSFALALSRSISTGAVVVVVISGATSSAVADITGFNFFGGWNYNPGDTGSPPNFSTPDSVEFTTGTNNRRSVWFTTPQSITSFSASFTYHASNISASTNRQGITFCLQNAGLTALGTFGSGLGYAGVTPSAAITIATDSGSGLTFSGFSSGGVIGASTATTPVNAYNGADINVSITYNGSVLSVAMVQGTNVAPPQNFVVGSLATTLGSSTALIGFTGGTHNTLGGPGGSRQFISNFLFTPIPSCYANCDGSTDSPVLNVADFTCFLSRFAANNPYTNCDHSTSPPILNVGDFTCFLTKYATGCP